MERTNYRRGVDLVDLVVLQGCELESNLCTSSLKLIGFRLDERIEKKCRSAAHSTAQLFIYNQRVLQLAVTLLVQL